MKNILIILLTLFASQAFAQRPKMENDTIYYQNLKVYKGGELNLYYGSGPKKNFVFVFIGSFLQGLTPLESGWSKQTVTVDKIYTQQGKFYARGILKNAPAVRALGGNKIFIDIEGALDNKEIY